MLQGIQEHNNSFAWDVCSTAKENILKSKQYPVVYLVILDVYEKVCLFLLPLAFSLSRPAISALFTYARCKTPPGNSREHDGGCRAEHARKSSFCFVILFILSFPPPLSTYLSKLFCRDYSLSCSGALDPKNVQTESAQNSA